MNLTANQRKILNILLDKYERSKTYDGTNQVVQNFAVEPTDIWDEYTSDFADVWQVKDFETEMEYLEQKGLISIRRKWEEISKLTACNDRIPEYYEILGRRPQKDIVEEQLFFYREWSRRGNAVIADFCKEQKERLLCGKKAAYPMEKAEKIFQILDFLLHNKEEYLERELSMLVLSDSKDFENNYRGKVCKILCEYMNFSDKLEGIDNDREREKVVLEEFGIYSNPSYVYLKGDLRITFADGRNLWIGTAPMALSSELLKNIRKIVVDSNNIVTIENLTSFHRVNADDCTYIYLAGYHNTEKQLLLKRIAEENPDRKWFHFGDIDPDGFYILEHLKRGTGIEFTPMFMGLDELRTYEKYCKELIKNDRVKAEKLIRSGCYAEVLQYMLEHNCKLEQEIISLRNAE